jgi:hypothetical protein
MKLLHIYTKSYERIYNSFFLKTVPSDVELVPIKIDNIDSIPGRVGMSSFKHLNTIKFPLILDEVKKNVGGVLVYSDIDVIFFKSFKKDVEREIINYDILLSDNGNNEYNVGFMVFNCNERTITFLETISNCVNEIQGFSGDQDFLNNKITRYNNITHKYLSENYFTNRTPYCPEGTYNTTLDDVISKIPTESFIFHCVATDGGEGGKYSVLNEIYNKLIK